MENEYVWIAKSSHVDTVGREERLKPNGANVLEGENLAVSNLRSSRHLQELMKAVEPWRWHREPYVSCLELVVYIGDFFNPQEIK